MSPWTVSILPNSNHSVILECLFSSENGSIPFVVRPNFRCSIITGESAYSLPGAGEATLHTGRGGTYSCHLKSTADQLQGDMGSTRLVRDD